MRPTRRALRALAIAGAALRIAEVEEKRWEQRFGASVRDLLGVSERDGTPMRLALDRRLLAREVVRGDRRIKVIGAQRPRFLIQAPRDVGFALGGDPPRTQGHDGIGGVEWYSHVADGRYSYVSARDTVTRVARSAGHAHATTAVTITTPNHCSTLRQSGTQ